MLWLKSLPYVLVAALFFLAGLTFQAKVLAPAIPACPECPSFECPPQTKLELNNFQPEKIKGIKSFTYSPSISGNIQVIVLDSATYKSIKKINN